MAILNGTSDALTLPVITGSVTAYTLAFRFRWFDTSELFPCIAASDNGTVVLTYFVKHHSFPGDPSNVTLQVTTGYFDTQSARPSQTSLHSFVIRWSGTNAQALLDGVSIASVTVSAASVTIPILFIGTDPTQTHFTKCWVNQLARYTRRWTDTEVANHAAGADPDTISNTNLNDYSKLINNFTPTVGSTVTQIGSPQLESTFSAACRVRVGSIEVGPGGDTLRLKIENMSGTLTGVTNVASGAKIVVNGGSPISLTSPAYDPDISSVLWSLNPYLIRDTFRVLDDAMVNAASGLTGTWTPRDGGYWESGLLLNGKLREASSPTATAAYVFTGLIAGKTYQVYTTLYPESSRSTAVAYTVTASGMTTVVFTINQQSFLSQDTSWSEVPWHLLGTVTIPATSATVTVSNTAGSGSVTINGIMLRQVLTPAIPTGATVTFYAPALTFSTSTGSSGDIPSTSPLAVTLPDRDTYYRTNPTAPRTMKIGYNAYPPYFWSSEGTAPTIVYANLARFAGGWQGTGVTYDSNWELTGCTGTAYQVLFTGCGTGGNDATGERYVDHRGVRIFKDGNYHWWFRHPTSTPPTVGFGDPNSIGIQIGSRLSITTVPESTWYVTSFTQTLAGPSSLIGYARKDLKVTITSTGACFGLVIFGPDTDPSWPYMATPTMYNRYHGKNLYSMRTYDWMNINDSFIYDYSQFANASKTNYMNPNDPTTPGLHYYGPQGWTVGRDIASLIPVDTTGADADNVRSKFLSGTLIIRLRLTGSNALFRDGCDVYIENLDLNSYGLTNGSFHTWGNLFSCFPVPSSTTDIFIGTWQFDGPKTNPVISLTGTQTPSGGIASVIADGFRSIPIPHIVRMCNEFGVGPWFNLPPTMTDSCADSVGDYLAANLDTSLITHMELGNEVWNDRYHHTWAFSHIAKRAGFGDGLDAGRAWVTYRTIQIGKRIKDRYTAAGKDPTKFHTVISGQLGWNRWTSDSIAILKNTSLFPTLPPVDEWALAVYASAIPNFNFTSGWPDTAAIYDCMDRLTVQGGLELFSTVIQDKGFAEAFQAHYDVITTTGGYTAPVMVTYEGGFEETLIKGNDTVPVKCVRTQAMVRHPDAVYMVLGMLRHFETCGWQLVQRYNDNGSFFSDRFWTDYNTPHQVAGPGTGSALNLSNPYDPDGVESTMGYGMQLWSGGPPAPPAITTQPANQTVATGATATFAVTATGSGLSYQWQRTNDSGATWVNLPAASAASYTTPTLISGDNGAIFRCLVSSVGGSVWSDLATLTVTGTGVSGTFTVTGPTSGPIDIASDPFTITRSSSSSTATITPTSSNPEDVFSPETLSLTTGTSSGTFILACPTSGDRVVSATCTELPTATVSTLTYRSLPKVITGGDDSLLKSIKDQIESILATSNLGGSTRVVYTSSPPSGMTVPVSDAVLTLGNITNGTDNTTSLQAILNLNLSGGSLCVIVDGKYTVSGLLVNSNTDIIGLPGCGFKRKSGTFLPTLKNATESYGVGSGATRTLGSFGNTNIRISGLTINCNANNISSYVSSGQPDIRVTAVEMFGVDDLVLDGLTVLDVPCYGVHMANVRGLTITRHKQVLTSVGSADGRDGIHISGPSDRVRISGCIIKSGDDAIAINANDGDRSLCLPTSGPGQFPYPGPITNVSIEDIHLDGCSRGIRFLSSDQVIDNISIRNVTGSVGDVAFLMSAFQTGGLEGGNNPQSGAGLIGSIKLSEFDVVTTNNGANPLMSPIFLHCNIDSFVARRIRCRPDGNNTRSFIQVTSAVTYNILDLEVDVLDLDSVNRARTIVSDSGVGDMASVRGRLRRPGLSAALIPAFVKAAGSLNLLRASLEWDRSTRAVGVAGGALTTVQMDGNHSNAAGGGALNVGSGLTVSNFGHINLLAVTPKDGSGSVTHDIGSGTYTEPSIDSRLTGLIASYRLDDANGTMVNDYSVNNRDGTANGSITHGAGIAGFTTCALGNGTNFYTISNASNAFTPGSGGFTVTGWVNFASVTAVQIVCGVNDGDTNVGFLMYLGADGKINWMVGKSAGGAGPTVASAALSAATTYFIRADFNGTDTVNLRINEGSPVTTTLTVTAAGSGGSLGIFADHRTPTAYQFGSGAKMDRLRFWNRLLTDPEAAAERGSGTGNDWE